VKGEGVEEEDLGGELEGNRYGSLNDKTEFEKKTITMAKRLASSEAIMARGIKGGRKTGRRNAGGLWGQEATPT